MSLQHQSFDKSPHGQFVASPHRVRNATNPNAIVTGERLLFWNYGSNSLDFDRLDQYTGNINDYLIVVRPAWVFEPPFWGELLSGSWPGYVVFWDDPVALGPPGPSWAAPSVIGMSVDRSQYSTAVAREIGVGPGMAAATNHPLALGQSVFYHDSYFVQGGAPLFLSDPLLNLLTDPYTNHADLVPGSGNVPIVSAATTGSTTWIVSGTADLEDFPGGSDFIRNLQNIPI